MISIKVGWDLLGRRLAARNQAIVTIPQLESTLQEESDSMPR